MTQGEENGFDPFDHGDEVSAANPPANEPSAWPQRPWLLALLGVVAGLIIYFISDPDHLWSGEETLRDSELRAAAIGCCFFGALALAFSLEKWRRPWAAGFAAISGLVLGAIIFWSGSYNQYGFEPDYAFLAGVFALMLATPIFQTLRDQWDGGAIWRRLDYERLHYHAWGDVVIGGSALIFLGASWLLLWLIAGLFDLIGLNFLTELIRNEWFALPFIGASYGVALGLLRENERILSTLQRVVLIVFSVMTPFLAAALAIFLLSLLFTGLGRLWDATDSTTPIVLSCAAAAILLANAVIRNHDSEASASRIFRISALVLSVTLLPLALIAVVSMGLRINQHGLTPERLWGVVTIIVAMLYGLGYWISLLRARKDWMRAVRSANVVLAVTVTAIALILALPIFDFGAISTRNQVARLESGAINPDQFDFAALKYDFGPAGERALKRLSGSKNAAIAKLAKNALKADDPWELRQAQKAEANKHEVKARLIIWPKGQEIDDTIYRQDFFARNCKKSACFAIITDDRHMMIVALPEASDKKDDSYRRDRPYFSWLENYGTGWRVYEPNSLYDNPQHKWSAEEVRKVSKDSKVEIRKVERKQVFIDGKPVGEAFDDPPPVEQGERRQPAGAVEVEIAIPPDN